MTKVLGTLWSGVLRNGVPVSVRPLRPDDRERIAKAFGKLDRESIYTRVFSYKGQLSEAELDRIVNVDPRREVALVVTTGVGDDEAIIASARYFEGEPRAGGRTAEVAFLVEEDYQGLGIAGRLLSALARIAAANGIERLEAEVLAENKPMLAVFARSGLPMSRCPEGGVVHLTLSLGSPAPDAPA